MPRNTKQSKRAGGSKQVNAGAERIEAVSGRIILRGTNVVGGAPALVGLTPGFGALSGTITANGYEKLNAMADLFQFFRFTRLSARFASSTTGQMNVLAYFPDEPITLPTTAIDVMTAPWVSDLVYQATTHCVPATPRAQVIPRRVLCQSNVKWWRTKISASVDDQFEYQGMISVGPPDTASGNVYWDLSYTCEFKNFIGAALTPLKPGPKPTDPETKDQDVCNVSLAGDGSIRLTGLAADWGDTENSRVSLTRTQAAQLNRSLKRLVDRDNV